MRFIIKGNKESFSDVIIKITGRASLAELAGVLSRKEAAELRANIAARRKALRERLRKTARILE